MIGRVLDPWVPDIEYGFTTEADDILCGLCFKISTRRGVRRRVLGCLLGTTPRTRPLSRRYRLGGWRCLPAAQTGDPFVKGSPSGYAGRIQPHNGDRPFRTKVDPLALQLELCRRFLAHAFGETIGPRPSLRFIARRWGWRSDLPTWNLRFDRHPVDDLPTWRARCRDDVAPLGTLLYVARQFRIGVWIVPPLAFGENLVVLIHQVLLLPASMLLRDSHPATINMPTSFCLN